MVHSTYVRVVRVHVKLQGGVRLASNQFGSQPKPAPGYSRTWQHVLQPTERNAAWQRGGRDTAALSFLSLPGSTSSAALSGSLFGSSAAQGRSLLASPGGSGADTPAGGALHPAPRSRGAAMPGSSLLAAIFGRSTGGGTKEASAAAAAHHAPSSGGGAASSSGGGGGGGMAAGVHSFVSSLLRPGVGGRSPASAASGASTLRTSPNSAALRDGLAADAAAVAAALSAGGNLGQGGQGYTGYTHGYGSSSSNSTSSRGSHHLAKSTAADEAAAVAAVGHLAWVRHGAAGAGGFFASALGDGGGGSGGIHASRPPRSPAVNGASPQDLAGLVGGM